MGAAPTPAGGRIGPGFAIYPPAMPNEAARTAYRDAQAIFAEMKRIHEQEAAILAGQAGNLGGTSGGTSAELQRLSDEWAALFRQYTRAMATYSNALDKAARDRRPTK